MVLHKYGDRLYNGVALALTQQLQTVAARIEAAQARRGARRRVGRGWGWAGLCSRCAMAVAAASVGQQPRSGRLAASSATACPRAH
jgi:hypothetical protein